MNPKINSCVLYQTEESTVLIFAHKNGAVVNQHYNIEMYLQDKMWVV